MVAWSTCPSSSTVVGVRSSGIRTNPPGVTPPGVVCAVRGHLRSSADVALLGHHDTGDPAMYACGVSSGSAAERAGLV
jgi:hypothetical protein